ncbi:hypothetical protein BH10PLA2_BH10PLA2_02230 [soil metagenome]
MIRYNYVTELTPPAPFVRVAVANPVTGQLQSNVPAQLDSAADRTVIPESLVHALNLHKVGTMLASGLGGATHNLAIYSVLLGVHDRPAVSISVLAHPAESWILLGRDVLNSFRIVLDGPNQALEFA